MFSLCSFAFLSNSTTALDRTSDLAQQFSELVHWVNGVAMRYFHLAALTISAGFGASGAFAQDLGACGQPAALNGGTLVLDRQPAEVVGAFTQITRNEPRYVELTVNAPMALTISTVAEGVDTTLILFDQQGRVAASNDDQRGSNAARIITKLEPGIYCAQVDILGTLDGAPTVVPISVEGAPPADACIRNAAPPVALGPGSQEIITTGTLSGSVDHAFTLAAGTGAKIMARSPIFDTFLTLEDESGITLATDDDSGGDTNSLLEVTPEAEERLYCIRLTGLNDEGGVYALSIEPQSEAGEPAQEDASVDAATRAARRAAQGAANAASADAAKAAEAAAAEAARAAGEAEAAAAEAVEESQ